MPLNNLTMVTTDVLLDLSNLGRFSDDESGELSLSMEEEHIQEERTSSPPGHPTHTKPPTDRLIKLEVSFVLNRMIRQLGRDEKIEQQRKIKMEQKVERLKIKEYRLKEREEEKSRLKLEKKRAKEEKKKEKALLLLREKEERQRQKDAERRECELIKNAEKEGMKKGRQMEREKIKRRLERVEVKYEIQDKAIRKMVKVAKQLTNEYPDGFNVTQCVEKYIELHGRINPYTLEEADPKYDLSAAIRGFMYETSPSSSQHWFRYGIKKTREQVAPWIFANKELAEVNSKYGWRITTSEMASERRQNIGMWRMIIDGSTAYYDWSEERYGPLPTREILEDASRERKVGIRG